jgi:hypothetical protein
LEDASACTNYGTRNTIVSAIDDEHAEHRGDALQTCDVDSMLVATVITKSSFGMYVV